ncbi:MAG: hypothetical protein GY788_17595 [bacterium]|nr:hypothetical protein [bacterium]
MAPQIRALRGTTKRWPSPGQYRALYLAGAANLNLVSGRLSIARYLLGDEALRNELSGEVQRLLGRSRFANSTTLARPFDVVLRATACTSLALLNTASCHLAELPNRAPDPPRRRRFVLTESWLNSNAAASAYRSRPFLKSFARPSALTLLAGTLQLRGQILLEPPGPRRTVASIGDLTDLVRDLAEQPVNKELLSALETVAGSDDEIGYRTRYNLACYQSRDYDQRRHRGYREDAARASLHEATNHLRRALLECPSRDRATLVANVRLDPALSAWRSSGETLSGVSLIGTGQRVADETTRRCSARLSIDSDDLDLDLTLEAKAAADPAEDDAKRSLTDTDVLEALVPPDQVSQIGSAITQIQEAGPDPTARRRTAMQLSMSASPSVDTLLARLLLLPET